MKRANLIILTLLSSSVQRRLDFSDLQTNFQQVEGQGHLIHRMTPTVNDNILTGDLQINWICYSKITSMVS